MLHYILHILDKGNNLRNFDIIVSSDNPTNIKDIDISLCTHRCENDQFKITQQCVITYTNFDIFVSFDKLNSIEMRSKSHEQLHMKICNISLFLFFIFRQGRLPARLWHLCLNWQSESSKCEHQISLHTLRWTFQKRTTADNRMRRSCHRKVSMGVHLLYT